MEVFTVGRDEHKQIFLEKPGEYTIELLETGAEATIRGAWDASNNTTIAVTVIVHHKAPHTQARTILHGVARDTSRVRFIGRIKIDPQCNESNSFLTERILLLSDNATAEAVPDLEILTDSVSCSHAASISRIPESQLFYLQSRGISRAVAENMIVAGFLDVSAE